jgi:hypothetical protein
VSVALDELIGDVRLECPRCHRMPVTRASRQVIRAGLAASTEPARRPIPLLGSDFATRTGQPRAAT